MEKTEHTVLAGIPVNAVSLALTRSAIKMQHSPRWSVDKVNSVHDLVICLTGSARYQIDGEEIVMTPGCAMLIEANMPFAGRSTSQEPYTGLAQHFSLEVFGRMDLISQMNIRRSVTLPHWSMLEPLVRYYRESVPLSSTTLIQHHMFMVLLIQFMEAAFLGWRPQQEAALNNPDQLSLAVMVASSRIAADPMDDNIVEQVLASIPYNRDYFRRIFRRQVGFTPTKYQEFKRMERAMGLLAGGVSVKKSAELTGFSDPYYFSRMFKHYIGVSPAGYKANERRHRDGQFPRGEEDGKVVYPLPRRASDRG
ncbi:AraC-like DNA-binding protein [Agrobacterium vitis]|nr:AraC-like DNA-binding protein [Agrobacterium vitis]MBE1439663.1 AraC-like DNA-binding protein [Agrobacterium vitis]